MEDIRTMLDLVASGELSVDQAVLELKKEPFRRQALMSWGLPS